MRHEGIAFLAFTKPTYFPLACSLMAIASKKDFT
jgi:hypothetical protein